jgi:hypothetical protein
MFMPTSDYNQQMLAYLQGWRQLLDQWTAMAAASSFMNAPFAMQSAPAGMPFMPPAAPFTPPMPASAQVPPAPADYTQQLFTYLQAWRQYLEQMTSASPGSAQVPPEPQTPAQPADASGDGPPNGGDGKGRPPGPPDGPTPPGGGGGGGTVSTSGVRTGSTVTWPPVELLPPGSYAVSQISGPVRAPVGPFVSGSDEPQVLNPPDYDFGYQFNGPRLRAGTAVPDVASAVRRAAPYAPEASPAQESVASPFSSAMERVEFGASPYVARKSLYSSASAEAASEILRQVRETPSP